MVVVVVANADVDVAEKLVVLVVVVVVSAHSAMEKLTATRMEIATIWEPIAILRAKITILLLPLPIC